MTKWLTFTNLASAVTFLGAGFAVGLVMGGANRFEEGVQQGRGELLDAERALTEMAAVVTDPAVLNVFEFESREQLEALADAIDRKDYADISVVLPLSLSQMDGASCKPNEDAFVVSAADSSMRNCETGRTALFNVISANRVDSVMDGKTASLAPANPSTWTFADGGSCTIAMGSYDDSGEMPTAAVSFQNCTKE